MAVGEAALIKAVRGLGQGGINGIPDSLTEIWKILLQYRGGSSFAVEKMLLRMLFKNMYGPKAERVRRYPLTWAVLGLVFSRVSTFSLAQALIDVNFVSILSQTFKELSEPQERTGSEALGKRKRPDEASFDLDAQREPSGCLRTAEALFQTLKSLISRCEPGSSGQMDGKMGSEHIKSLFYAIDWREHREILLQLLNLCNLSLGSDETYEGQISWTSTFVTLWDLHMGNETESLEIAKYLSAPCTEIIRKLTAPIEEEVLATHQMIRDSWIQDLRTFLTRHLILPIRALSLNHGGQENMITVTIHMGPKPGSFPILFDLVLNAPSAAGSLSAKKSHEIWVHEVFDVIEEALREGKSKRKTDILLAMLGNAKQNGATLSLKTLRLICEKHALQSDRVNWDILQSLVELDPDVFLVSQNTRDLLEDVLRWTRTVENLSDTDFAKASRFVVCLAKGFAVARDFSGFLQKWHENLSSLDIHLHSRAPENVWSTRELVTVVSQVVQASLNAKQLQDVLDWLEMQSTPAQKAASTLVLEAVSLGIRQDDCVDVAGTRLLALVFSGKDEEPLSTDIRAARWTIAERTLSWGTLNDREQAWPKVAAKVKQVLGRSSLDLEDTFAAFKCAVAAWVGYYPNGKYEQEASNTVCLLVRRLTAEKTASATKEQDSFPLTKYFTWIAQESRLLSLLEKRDSNLFKVLVESTEPGKRASGLHQGGNVRSVAEVLEAYTAIIRNENNTNHPELMNGLVEQLGEVIQQNNWSSEATGFAVASLLEIPVNYLSSNVRQEIARHLLRHSQAIQDPSIACIKRNLSLLVRVMEKPVLYEGMDFQDLDSTAHLIVNAVKGETWSDDDLLGLQEAMALLEELTLLILQRVTSSSMERDHNYLSKAVRIVEADSGQNELSKIPRLLHLKSFVAKLTSLSRTKGLDIANIIPQLVGAIDSQIRRFLAAWSQKSHLWSTQALLGLLTALHAADSLNEGLLRNSLRSFISDLMRASNELVARGLKAGWEIKIFLAKHFDEAFQSPLDLVHVEATVNADVDRSDSSNPPKVDKDIIVEFFDVVVQNIDEDAKLEYLKELLSLKVTDDRTHQLLVDYLLIHRIKDVRPAAAANFDLATAHILLSEKMLETRKVDEFILVAQTLHMLFAQKPASMDQWNIELTLGNVSVVCSTLDSRQLSSPRVYQWLCRLTQILISRYRKRLQGRTHLLVTALQALLQCLTTHPTFWDKHAKLYTRLLTQICEPTATSANRGGADRAALESDRDEVKRYVGQYMYMVLMQYIKLLVQHHVPHGIRETLEPGIHAILDVTTKDSLRIMNDALDSSGRVIMKDLYKRYEKFGKWTGV